MDRHARKPAPVVDLHPKRSEARAPQRDEARQAQRHGGKQLMAFGVGLAVASTAVLLAAYYAGD